MVMLLLLLAGWQGSVCGQWTSADGQRDEVADQRPTLGATRDDRPQWQDLGMENVLVVSQPTVEAPSTLRIATDGATPMVRRADSVQRYFRMMVLAAASPHRAMSGYLYFLLCLRL